MEHGRKLCFNLPAYPRARTAWEHCELTNITAISSTLSVSRFPVHPPPSAEKSPPLQELDPTFSWWLTGHLCDLVAQQMYRTHRCLSVPVLAVLQAYLLCRPEGAVELPDKTCTYFWSEDTKSFKHNEKLCQDLCSWSQVMSLCGSFTHLPCTWG